MPLNKCKGGKDECNNYRRMSLFSVQEKMFGSFDGEIDASN